MKTPRSKKIIRDIGEKHNLFDELMLTFTDIENIVSSPFEFIADTIKEGNPHTGEFKNIRLVKFGIFFVNEFRKKYLKEKYSNYLTKGNIISYDKRSKKDI